MLLLMFYKNFWCLFHNIVSNIFIQSDLIIVEMDVGGESIMGRREENWRERKIVPVKLVHGNDHGNDPIVSVIFAGLSRN